MIALIGESTLRLITTSEVISLIMLSLRDEKTPTQFSIFFLVPEAEVLKAIFCFSRV